MSTFDQYFQLPNTKKIVLAEIDIGEEQLFFANYRAGVYFVNFDNVYADATKMEIDSDLLIEVPALTITITYIGSVRSDGINLSYVSTAALVETTEKSFTYIQDEKNLYIHLEDGEPPQLHTIKIGNMYGLYMGNATSSPEGDGVYRGFPYDSRMTSISSLSKSKDPLFFGKISYNSATITINNTDGEYDTWTTDNDVFGSEVRIYLGFKDIPFSEFRRIFTGYVERVSIGPDSGSITIQDNRKQLSRAVPNNVFSQSTYPNLRDDDIGKPIPWAYGTILNAPVICTNYDEAAPSTYTFKAADVSEHIYGIKSVDAAYIDGVTTSVESSSLTNGTFNLYASAFTNVSDTQKVSVDFKGYVDSGSALIENGLDVIQDLLSIFYGYTNTTDFYNTTEWATATSNAFDIGLFMNSPKGVIDWIEEISSSMQGDFIIEDAGTYTYRIYDAARAVSQEI